MAPVRQTAHLPAKIAQVFRPIYVLFENKYYLTPCISMFSPKARAHVGTFFWKVGDTAIIDNGIVNGSAKLVGAIAAQVRKVQTGFIYTHAAIWYSAYWYCSSMTFWDCSDKAGFQTACL